MNNPFQCPECAGFDVEVTLCEPARDGLNARQPIDFVKTGVLPISCNDCGGVQWRAAGVVAEALRAEVRSKLPPNSGFAPFVVDA